jgi:putative membrane protein
MLFTHVVLAAAIVPLVLVSLRRGLAMQVASHRRIARVTFPLWMYVSVTGVLVYIVLYVIYG